ncbi:MAG: tRNA (adenosine(37)-N6)-threonylcarbamoyltransferase complex transferase subunit TsaD [Oscillospiraceae bacterium]|nr:tRNA (adenosine(37)-N6)-threonylcarbamoyltransferase complex transferase subunit TsaD [Oscillospiraceae bacterium]
MLILGIESSCDETSVAVVRDGRKILSNVVATQIPEHRLYGGVVPEIASRRHTENICPVTKEALLEASVELADIDAVAVTYAPGLIGALLVGLNFAKGLCYSAGMPMIPVHHLRGHIASLYLSNPELKPPFVALVVSGGHTHMVLVKDYTEFEVLGRAVDDAAGEAFDKVARTLGLPYPGGPEISKLAKNGNPNTYSLPTPHTTGEFDVSFSGLKTAVLNLVNSHQMKGDPVIREDIAAVFEQKVTDILADRLVVAATEYGLNAGLCGGVSINGELQRKCAQRLDAKSRKLYLPERSLCGDNGAMIASAGYFEYLSGVRGKISQNAYATLDISTLVG